VNLETQRTEDYKAPSEETGWSRVKKALGPIAVVGVVIAKFFAKLKFVLLPLLKFLPILLKSGGTMLLMIWVYTQFWAGDLPWDCGPFVRARIRALARR